MRPLLLLLLLAPFAPAQTVGELVDRAMRATTGPTERLETMEELLKREDGAAALAGAGLDPLRDPEVVHMTVEVLLGSGRAGPHMAGICRLLLSERHKVKVEERIYRHAEQAKAARELVTQLAPLARGSDEAARNDVELRRAAIKALGRVPHRDAVAVIASVWGEKDLERGVAAECELQLDSVLLAGTGREAVTELDADRYATYTDLIKKVSRVRGRQERRWKGLAERFVGGYFAQAGHEEVLRALEKGIDLEKAGAAKRARVLAEKRDYGKDLGAQKFGERLVAFLLGEMEKGPTPAARDVVAALAAMSRDKAFGDAGLPRAAALRDALVSGAGGGADTAEFAEGAMELLSGMGADAMQVLGEFAGRHANADVRRAAVEALASIANRAGAGEATRRRVGDMLSDLLAADPPAQVRSRILFFLRTLPAAKAVPTIARLLDEEDANKALDPSDAINAMEMLASTPSEDALALLERLAKLGRTEQIRIDAIDHGLVRRLRGGLQPARVGNVLSELVRDREQPDAVRRQVLASLGGPRGHLRAAALLGTLAADGELEPAMRKSASAQRVAIAERLVKGNGESQLARADFEAIAAIIAEEKGNEVDAEKLERLAYNAVQAAVRQKIPGGLLRTRYAELRDARKDATEADRRAAWKDAADNAAADGLTDAQRREALRKYRELTKGAERVQADMELLRLAAARNDAARFGHWLDALEGATTLKNKPLADQVFAARPAGDFPAEDAARRDRLTQAYRKLE